MVASPSRALAVLDDTAPARALGRTAIVLVNVGTPDAPTTAAVRSYLREFLSDPRVLDMNAVARWLLLRLVILPFRSPKSAAMYRTVWTERGSPLLVHSLDLAEKLRGRFRSPGDAVFVGMRYGAPRLSDAVDQIRRGGFSRVVLVPLFPQYASASTGTALAEAYRLLGELPRVPDVTVVPPFFLDPGFITTVASTIREVTDAKEIDHVLFSYHSIPVHHVQNIHASCANEEACCATLGADNADCYRAQCLATTNAVMKSLARTAGASAAAAPPPFSNSFQSRLGRAAWLTPNTELVLDELARKGVKRLAVVCPSFVADCLETLEEIGVRARERFLAAGGQELVAIPCVNADDAFADAVSELVRKALGGPALDASNDRGASQGASHGAR